MTGLLNRRGFAAILTRAVEQARRGRGSALIYGDLDEFKACNDALGHAAGDAALVAVAHALLAESRSVDAVARLGGDEFAVLLDGANLSAALAVSECARGRIEELSVSVGARMSMSAGLVVVDGVRDAEGVLDAADRAMYGVKAGPDGLRVVAAGTNGALDAHARGVGEEDS